MHPLMLQDLGQVHRSEALARAERSRMVKAAREAKRSGAGAPTTSRFFPAGALKLGRAVRRIKPAANLSAPAITRREEGCASC